MSWNASSRESPVGGASAPPGRIAPIRRQLGMGGTAAGTLVPAGSLAFVVIGVSAWLRRLGADEPERGRDRNGLRSTNARATTTEAVVAVVGIVSCAVLGVYALVQLALDEELWFDMMVIAVLPPALFEVVLALAWTWLLGLNRLGRRASRYTAQLYGRTYMITAWLTLFAHMITLWIVIPELT